MGEVVVVAPPAEALRIGMNCPPLICRQPEVLRIGQAERSAPKSVT